MRTELNSKALTEWCNRHGLKADQIAADVDDKGIKDDRHVYGLRRLVGVGESDPPYEWEWFEVSVPIDDPMPPLYRLVMGGHG